MSSLPEPALRSLLESLTLEEKAAKLYDWRFWARDNQLPPLGNWQTWLILAGRGFGKTRTGAEWVRERIQQMPLVNLIAATVDDARDIMVEGESGILAICPDSERPQYRKSERKLLWPNGALSLIFTADEPERLRGKQHMSLWCDELAAWRYPAAWDQAMFGLRIGPDPRCVVTTTPKPTPLMKALEKDPNTVVTRGTTYENQGNLNPAFFRQIIKKYEGTRLGRQELLAEILGDRDGALWNRALLEETRVTEAPQMARVVVAVDPPAGDGEDEEAAECGIVVAGLGTDGHGYVLEDASVRGSPHQWATAAVAAYHRHRADRIVAEVNQGGAMVEGTLRTVNAHFAYKAVHAARGKMVRAEPVAALYEQQRCHHQGMFPLLEDQMCEWVPGETSPDRLDALVWSLTELFHLDVKEERPHALAGMIRHGGVRGWMPK